MGFLSPNRKASNHRKNHTIYINFTIILVHDMHFRQAKSTARIGVFFSKWAFLIKKAEISLITISRKAQSWVSRMEGPLLIMNETKCSEANES